jgi:Na+/alanine symporter
MDRMKQILLAVGFASIFTIVSWAAVSLPPERSSEDWIRIPGSMLQIPGGLVAAALAIFLSPQGIHGIDEFEWIILPMTWIFYFAVSYWILRRATKMLA